MVRSLELAKATLKVVGASDFGPVTKSSMMRLKYIKTSQNECDDFLSADILTADIKTLVEPQVTSHLTK